MAVQSYSIEIQAINMYKFAALASPLATVPDLVNSISLLPQVHEVTVYESIFSPLLKCELAIFDYIGLFTNFPLTGEEVIIVEYKNIGDNLIRRWTFAIDSITDIINDENNRATGYILNCVAIEGLANALTTIQKSYSGTGSEIARQIFDEHITERIHKFYPTYRSPTWISESNSTEKMLLTVPNMRPLPAIDMVQQLTYSNVQNKYTYLFYQTAHGFNYRTLQGLTKAANARRFAVNNKYKYFADEITDSSSRMNNKERIISNLTFNKRHSAMQKIATGYFNNNLFEINIAQKAVHSTRASVDQIDTISPGLLNTEAYKNWADSCIVGDESSNRTRYAVTSRAEHNVDFPVLMARERWGRDLISRVALSQIDVTVVIPGTNRFVAGDLFFLEIPEFHGFENLKTDDLVSGIYIITDIKQIIRIGGIQSTVLRLNKDSYNNSVDRRSRYK